METIGSSDSGNENEGTDAQAPLQAQVAKSKGKSGSVLSYFSREARGKSGNCSGTSSETSISSNSGKNIKKRKDQKDTQSYTDYEVNKSIFYQQTTQ